MDISPQDINALRKKIELIGIDIKGLDQVLLEAKDASIGEQSNT
jgi:hypothetical protein